MIYVLKDGSKVEGPEDATSEEKAWLTAQGAKPQSSRLADTARSAVSGIGEGLVRAPFIAGDLSTMLSNLVRGTFDKKAVPARLQSDQVLDIFSDLSGTKLHTPETTPGRYANTIGNFVGGSALGGAGAFKLAPSMGSLPGVGNTIKALMARGLQTPIVQNAIGGATAELAGDASRGFDETRQQNPAARLAGGLAGGLGAGIAGRVAAPKQDQMIYNATKTMTPAQWEKAKAVNQQLAAAGAKSQTIPDTLPSTSTLRGVAQEISNAPGGQALYNKLAGRDEGEISSLLAEAKKQMQQSAVPNVSPLPGKAGTDDFLADIARSNRTNEMLPVLRNAPLLPEENVQNIVSALKGKARLPHNAGTEDASYGLKAAETINALRRRMEQGKIGVNTEALSKVVKGLQNVDAQVGGPAGQVLKNNAAVGAAGEASSLLRKESPEYVQAMQLYADKSPQVELTRLLADNKLRPIPNSARSGIGEDKVREQLAALMTKIDPANTPLVTGKLAAADRLSQLRPEMGAQNVEAQYGSTLLAKAAAPFGSTARGSNTMMRGKVNAQVANLLANPTPENYAILQRMGQADPSIRKLLANIGNVGGASAAAQTQGSE
jgi:hypothetical protein